jgi:ABC-type glycerol-3-phosphate transport system permease component
VQIDEKPIASSSDRAVVTVQDEEFARSIESARRSARRSAATSRLSKLVVFLLLVAGVVVFILPFYVMTVMALKSQNEVATTSMWALPKTFVFNNFKEVWTNPNVSFLLFLKNSSLITFTVTFGVLVSSAVVAYAFARMEFRGRDRLFLILLATMMLPGIVTMIPSYVLFAKLHWVNTFLPLTVPAFFGSAFFIFLLRQFYMGIPRELDEAAVIDGAGHWTIFSRIIVPNSGAALATVAMFTFMGAWRDFMGPLLYLNDPDKQTLEVGLRTFAALRAEKWHLLMAASIIVVIPLILIFFIGQRYFVKGIVMTGGK